MRWILSARMIGKTAYHSEAAFSLRGRRRFGRPIDGSLSPHPGFAAIRGKAGKIMQQTPVHLHLKSGCASQLKVSVDNLFQHDEPPLPGHG